MNQRGLQRLCNLWHADFFSPKDFLRRALVVLILFLVAHLAGWREFSSLLNGTMGSVELGWHLSLFFGLSYIVLYLALVLLVPILILAATLLLLWRGIFGKKHSTT